MNPLSCLNTLTKLPVTYQMAHAYKLNAICVATLSALALSTPAVIAASVDEKLALEVITVTAEKREKSVLDVASSITAKDAEYLDDGEIYDLTELSQHVPNLLVFNWGGRRDTNIFMRGIGPGLFTDPTVGFYVDGINYTNNGAFDFELMDIKHVEILRGPQGSLYGGNSLAGVINIVTNEPSDEFQAKAALTVDNLSRRQLSGTLNTPINDELYLNTAVSIRDADGYIDNIYQDETFGKREDISARTKLKWQVNERLDATFILDYEHFRGHSYAMGAYDAIKAKPQQISHDFIGEDDRDSFGAAITINWEGDNVDMMSITSWRDWDNYNSADQDAGSLAGLLYHSMTHEEHQQLSQEIRWSNKHTNALSWLFGLYAYQADFDVSGTNAQDFSAWGMPGLNLVHTNSTKDNSGYAAFGQLDFSLTEQLILTTGLRYDWEKRDAFIDQAPDVSDPTTKLQGDKTFEEVLPKLALSYTTEQSELLYASLSQGYRAGGFDTLYPNLAHPTYDSESSTNFEIGYKAQLLDKQLEISAALFFIEIKDQQIQQLIPETGTIITENAGESQSRGIEFESRYIPAEDWLITFTSSYTKAEFNKYDGLNLLTYAIEDYSSNALPNTPEFTASLSIQNRHAIGQIIGSEQWDTFSQIDTKYVGSHYFDAPNQLQQDAYLLVNAKVGIESEHWQAYLWLKNATDEYYSKVEFDFGFGRTTEAAEPRAAGITVRYRY